MYNEYFVFIFIKLDIWKQCDGHFVLLYGKVKISFVRFGNCFDSIELILEKYVDIIYPTDHS